MMENLISLESIVFPLNAKDKKDAVCQLVNKISYDKDFNDNIFNKVWEREKKLTTGIGWGIAIPHCYASSVDKLIVKVGFCPLGVDFQSIDDKKVKLVFLDVAPENRPEIHQKYLQRISGLLSKPENRDLLFNAVDKEDFLESFNILESSFH